MLKQRFFYGFLVLTLGVGLAGCGNLSPEKAQADATALFNASYSSTWNNGSLGDPEPFASGTVVQCRPTGMAQVYYCTWRTNLNDGKSIGEAALSLHQISPGTPVNAVRMYYKTSEDSDGWTYAFFLESTAHTH